MTRPVLVIATRNPGKRREFASLLADLPIDLLDLTAFPQAPDVAEDGDTYLANARAKALAIAGFTGLPALADDSGLEVDALGGQPGVRSARFAGPQADDRQNLERVLALMRDVPGDRRRARFRCVIVVARPGGRVLTGEGICDGWLASEPSGAGGFGYDPIFHFPPAACTFAELSPAEKNRVSHRARACAALRSALPSFLAGPD